MTLERVVKENKRKEKKDNTIFESFCKEKRKREAKEVFLLQMEKRLSYVPYKVKLTDRLLNI